MNLRLILSLRSGSPITSTPDEITLHSRPGVVQRSLKEPEDLSRCRLAAWGHAGRRVGVQAGEERVGGHGESLALAGTSGGNNPSTVSRGDC